MSGSASQRVDGRRKGWCPGALRPMKTGDGLLVRLRITAGIVSPDLAAALADCAELYGNGVLDLTSRANLQLRGVGEATLLPLQDRLAALGLLDDDPEGESVRNVMVSPLAGIDPGCAAATLAIARGLEARLTSDVALHALPAKFGFLVDGGGALPLDGVAADVALRARRDGFDVEVGGRVAATVSASEAVEAALDCARTTLAGGGDPALPPIAPPLRLAGYDARARFLAAAIPFGRLDASQLRILAFLAKDLGAGLRLTPWRAILLAPLATADAPGVAEAIAAAGLVVDAADPRLAVAACSGKPACLSGEADVRRDAALFALALAPLLGAGASLHVSGCPKGCARRGPADFTLVAEAGGYRLARNASVEAARGMALMSAGAMAAHLSALASLETEGRHEHA